MSQYQEGYSEKFQSQFDLESRIIKARKIEKVINDFSGLPQREFRCLDVGCSTGINLNFLSEFTGPCVGIDIDRNALPFARAHAGPNTVFAVGDAMHLPFRDECFDIVICNHIYEHVPDSRLMMDEIFRVLKHGGFCYFAGGNKYSIVEPHYRLPFLSWLPKFLANEYLKCTGNGIMYYENHQSYWQLKQLAEKFTIIDYTVRIILEPDRFGAADMIKPGSSLRSVPGWFFYFLKPMIPTYIFILTKR